LTILWKLAISFVAVAAIYTLVQQQGTDHKICVQVQQNKSYIYNSIIRSEKTLPTISYYKHHPDELTNQLKLIREAKADFVPKKC